MALLVLVALELRGKVLRAALAAPQERKAPAAAAAARRL
jgi:hypothetical protein